MSKRRSEHKNNADGTVKSSRLFGQRVGHFFNAIGFRMRSGFSKINRFFENAKTRYLIIGSVAFDCLLAAVIAAEILLPAGKTVSSAVTSDTSGQEYRMENEFSESRVLHDDLLDRLLEDKDADDGIVSVTMDDLTPLTYGTKSDRVEILQIALTELGFLDIDETTNYYGPATREAVKCFQRQHGLEKSGDADNDTLTLLFSPEAHQYVLSSGDEGEDVREIQRQLMDLAYMDKATGYYGDQTIDAVKDFQTRNSLDVTGEIDPKTKELLYMPDAVEGENYAVKTRRRAVILKFVEVAEQQLGKRYSLGSTGPNAFDCSGLVYYCLRQAGSNRRRLSADGYAHITEWEKISSMHDLEIGDLLFFHIHSQSSIGHVGIYVGGGKMIDASFSNGKMVKQSIWTSYWTKRFAYARRPW